MPLELTISWWSDLATAEYFVILYGRRIHLGTWQLVKNFFHWSIFNAGVGKTSLVHLITEGQPISRPRVTAGCNVSVKVRIGLRNGKCAKFDN
jgi:hypothetical protein